MQAAVFKVLNVKDSQRCKPHFQVIIGQNPHLPFYFIGYAVPSKILQQESGVTGGECLLLRVVQYLQVRDITGNYWTWASKKLYWQWWSIILSIDLKEKEKQIYAYSRSH